MTRNNTTKQSFPKPAHRQLATESGFTLIEIVMIIVILGVLATAITLKWPSDMKGDAAVLDFIRAVRYAQHLAMTREYDPAQTNLAWGVNVSGNRYTVQTVDGSATGDSDYVNHALPGNLNLSGGPVYFNGLGEPIDGTGTLLGTTLFTVGSRTVTVYTETGYVE